MSAEALHNFKNMGSQEHRAAMGNKPLQEPLESSSGDGVNAFKWFIEKQYLRPVDYDGAQSMFPAQFDRLMAELRIIAPAIGRSICLEPVARRGWGS